MNGEGQWQNWCVCVGVCVCGGGDSIPSAQTQNLGVQKMGMETVRKVKEGRMGWDKRGKKVKGHQPK